MKRSVIALPGGVMPAAARYASLADAVKDEAEFHSKDLEVYASDPPPPEHSVDDEVAALAGFADSLGLKRFHLVGYSGGGFVSLAFAAVHPERLLSLAVFEPARIPGDPTPEESAWNDRLRRAVAGREGADFMDAFVKLQLRPGVVIPPPSGPPPPWMRTRPAGIAALIRAFDRHRLDRNGFREWTFPVFYGYGDQTVEIEAVQGAVLARLVPDIRIRRFAGVHHFVPPEQIYNAEHVQALRELWARADSNYPHPNPPPQGGRENLGSSPTRGEGII